jgi:hypothetical protein
LSVRLIAYIRLSRVKGNVMSRSDRERAVERVSKWRFGLIIAFTVGFAAYNQIGDLSDMFAAVFAYILSTFVLIVGVMFVVHLARTAPR